MSFLLYHWKAHFTSELFSNGKDVKVLVEDTKENDGGVAKKYSVDAICLFKKGIRPEWEDPQNASGGQWSCRRGNRFSPRCRSL